MENMSNQPEEQAQQQAQEQKEIKTEAEDERKTEAKAKNKPKTLEDVKVDFTPSGQTVPQVVLTLQTKDFDEKEVWKIEEVYALLGNYGIARVIETARKRWLKWQHKRGANLPEEAQNSAYQTFQIIALIDYLRKMVLDSLGVTGIMRGLYRSYMLKLTSTIMKNEPSGWLAPAYQRFREWQTKPECNKDVLKALTWITLKGMAWYYRILKKF
jgi:hypothetical protein